MKEYSFEKLKCWQHARKLAVSIAYNLAEGTSRKSTKDQQHFSTISYSSTIELLNDLIISKDLAYLPEEKYVEGRSLIEFQTFLIANLRKLQRSEPAGFKTKPS